MEYEIETTKAFDKWFARIKDNKAQNQNKMFQKSTWIKEVYNQYQMLSIWDSDMSFYQAERLFLILCLRLKPGFYHVLITLEWEFLAIINRLTQYCLSYVFFSVQGSAFIIRSGKT